MKETAELAWEMICELRLEVREAQKIRTQVIGFKITFVTASFGFIFGMEEPNHAILFLPAFAGVFFDYLIVSYGYSIKRIGYYCRLYLEPKLRAGVKWPPGDPFWEEAMSIKAMKQHFSNAANLGMTALAMLVVAVFLRGRLLSWELGILFALLVVLYALDVYFAYWFKYTPRDRLVWPPDKP